MFLSEIQSRYLVRPASAYSGFIRPSPPSPTEPVCERVVAVGGHMLHDGIVTGRTDCQVASRSRHSSSRTSRRFHPSAPWPAPAVLPQPPGSRPADRHACLKDSPRGMSSNGASVFTQEAVRTGRCPRCRGRSHQRSYDPARRGPGHTAASAQFRAVVPGLKRRYRYSPPLP